MEAVVVLLLFMIVLMLMAIIGVMCYGIYMFNKTFKLVGLIWGAIRSWTALWRAL